MILPAHVAEQYREPIALKGDDGAVRAWACPRCHRVSVGISCGGPKGREQEAEYSRETAMKCGICEKCGHRCECGYQSRCDSCREKDRAQWQREAEERRPEREQQQRVIEASRTVDAAAIIADPDTLTDRISKWEADDDNDVMLVEVVKALAAQIGCVSVSSEAKRTQEQT